MVKLGEFSSHFCLDCGMGYAYCKCEKMHISDGYHTFDELYEHRSLLFMCLCRALSHKVEVYRAKDPNADGWFIVYIIFEFGQISYHLPDKYWDLLDDIDTVEYGSIYDGHTSDDVLERLKKFLENGL